ncbi:hypothetical protein ACFQ09_00960 [Massilia norwichensis]|uniref:DUF4410 domain-containing protein n=1 Tax=Massilia norwichensis TaxID=1442366 RepID=A0ABT2A0M7_9BURK|nr:hypothetical protein [Massilia norwichensis]MCS0587733.1 hypothetical protein [Massilia norwichensis]
MKNTRRTVLLATTVLAAGLMQGCATRIKAASTDNPPPSKAFSAYSRIVVKPVVFREGYHGSQAGLAKIEENLRKDLGEKAEQWNNRPNDGSVLTVEPVVEELSFKRIATRVFLGPLAGSSGVLMRVSFRDQNGNVIANPEFFQRTAAFSGGFTLGVTDNLMLTRVANLASGYIIANYDKAVGGPTGADDKAVRHN